MRLKENVVYLGDLFKFMIKLEYLELTLEYLSMNEENMKNLKEGLKQLPYL